MRIYGKFFDKLECAKVFFVASKFLDNRMRSRIKTIRINVIKITALISELLRVRSRFCFRFCRLRTLCLRSYLGLNDGT